MSNDGLEIETGWIINCWRCCEVGTFIGTPDQDEARKFWESTGWRVVDGFQMCPACLEGAK